MSGKEYVRRMPLDWFLRRPTYRLFMLRELTSLFVGGYAIFLLVLFWKAGNEQGFVAFVEGLKSPISVLLHLAALGMAAFHSITWFNLTPKVLVIWRGTQKVSPVLIAGSNYVVWIVVSALVAWIALG